MAKTVAKEAKPKAMTFTISLRPDRIGWIRQAANAKGVSASEIVRDLVDEARKQAERESMTA